MGMSRGERIAWIRRQYGLTQADMATRLGVHRVSVAQWERGAAVPRLETWERIQRMWDKLKVKKKRKEAA